MLGARLDFFWPVVDSMLLVVVVALLVSVILDVTGLELVDFRVVGISLFVVGFTVVVVVLVVSEVVAIVVVFLDVVLVVVVVGIDLLVA